MLSPREWAKWAILCDPNEWQVPPTLVELIDRVETAIIGYRKQHGIYDSQNESKGGLNDSRNKSTVM